MDDLVARLNYLSEFDASRVVDKRGMINPVAQRHLRRLGTTADDLAIASHRLQRHERERLIIYLDEIIHFLESITKRGPYSDAKRATILPRVTEFIEKLDAFLEELKKPAQLDSAVNLPPFEKDTHSAPSNTELARIESQLAKIHEVVSRIDRNQSTANNPRAIEPHVVESYHARPVPARNWKRVIVAAALTATLTLIALGLYVGVN